jgi:hypothetical protein
MEVRSGGYLQEVDDKEGQREGAEGARPRAVDPPPPRPRLDQQHERPHARVDGSKHAEELRVRRCNTVVQGYVRGEPRAAVAHTHDRDARTEHREGGKTMLKAQRFCQ